VTEPASYFQPDSAGATRHERHRVRGEVSHGRTVLVRPADRIRTEGDYCCVCITFACERTTQWPVSPLPM
jgi:hypothetical protein